jgi:AhpD family alkylhydroperoxidase
MTSTARIPHAEITGLFGALVKRFTLKKFGVVPEPLRVMWHNLPVLRAYMAMNGKVEGWVTCDPNLKSFAHMAVASLVGCGFCLDIGYYQAHNKKLDVHKAREVPRWRESSVFTPLERDVLEYAEAMTRLPLTVTDELSARLLNALGAAALVELTAHIALSNMATRTNTALGVESQGLAAACQLRPLARPSHAPHQTATTAP